MKRKKHTHAVTEELCPGNKSIISVVAEFITMIEIAPTGSSKAEHKHHTWSSLENQNLLKN